MSHYTWEYRDGNLPTLTNTYKSIEQTIKTTNGLLQWMHQGTLGNIQDQRSALQPFYHDHRLKIDAKYADQTIADSPIMKSDTADSREIYFNMYPISVSTNTKKQTKNMGQKTPHHRRLSWKTKTKNRPMGLHGNIQTANRWIPTVLEHQRSRRNHTIQIEKNKHQHASN